MRETNKGSFNIKQRYTINQNELVEYLGSNKREFTVQLDKYISSIANNEYFLTSKLEDIIDEYFLTSKDDNDNSDKLKTIATKTIAFLESKGVIEPSYALACTRCAKVKYWFDFEPSDLDIKKILLVNGIECEECFSEFEADTTCVRDYTHCFFCEK